MNKLILLSAFLISFNLCFAQKVKYGTFHFERIDSAYHKAHASQDTFMGIIENEMSAFALGEEDLDYRSHYQPFSYSFDKHFLMFNKSNEGRTIINTFSFYDFIYEETHSFSEKENGITYKKRNFLFILEPNQKVRYEVIFHKNTRKEILDFDCFKIEINEFFDEKLIKSAFAYVTDQVSTNGNKIHFIAGVPDGLCVLYYESFESDVFGDKKTFISAVSFDNKKPKLKKHLKRLVNASKPYAFPKY